MIDLYGVGTAYITALNFEQKKMSTPYFINLKHISSDQNRQAMLSNKDSVAIVISYSGEEQEIKRIVNYIKQKEGTVIAVTSINDSYLRKNADYCLTICSKENIFSKIGSYSSKVSADYIMDIIFALLFKNNNNINLIEKLERAKREEKRNTRIAIEATRRSREQRNKIKQLEEEISKERSRRESIAGARRNKK